MRIVDILYAFPSLLFTILLMTFFRNTLSNPAPGSFGAALSALDSSLGGMLFIFIGIGLTLATDGSFDSRQVLID
jgi:oligopeptide transport system permease protein